MRRPRHPVLHDGGVTVGPDAERQLGMPGTLMNRVAPDPANSLRALVDRDLRLRLVEANRAHADLRDLGCWGTGHELWVDAAAGFSADEQHALVHYLLAFRP
jgi:hypothetical protein